MAVGCWSWTSKEGWAGGVRGGMNCGKGGGQGICKDFLRAGGLRLVLMPGLRGKQHHVLLFTPHHSTVIVSSDLLVSAQNKRMDPSPNCSHNKRVCFIRASRGSGAPGFEFWKGCSLSAARTEMNVHASDRTGWPFHHQLQPGLHSAHLTAGPSSGCGDTAVIRTSFKLNWTVPTVFTCNDSHDTNKGPGGGGKAKYSGRRHYCKHWRNRCEWNGAWPRCTALWNGA